MLKLQETQRDGIVAVLSGLQCPPMVGRNIANICDFLNSLPSDASASDSIPVSTAEPVAAADSAPSADSAA